MCFSYVLGALQGAQKGRFYNTILYRKKISLKKSDRLFSLLLGALQGAKIVPRGALQGAPRDFFLYNIVVAVIGKLFKKRHEQNEELLLNTCRRCFRPMNSAQRGSS